MPNSQLERNSNIQKRILGWKTNLEVIIIWVMAEAKGGVKVPLGECTGTRELLYLRISHSVLIWRRNPARANQRTDDQSSESTHKIPPPTELLQLSSQKSIVNGQGSN